MSCPHSKIEAALDRWSECHWYIHQMEAHYHEPDLFRYSLNSLIRSIKEIPQILEMELQNHKSYKDKLKSIIGGLKKNELVRKLSKQRDFIVHQGMLGVLSTGHIGTTEGGGFKIAIGFNVDPYESSYEAYDRYKDICRKNDVFRGAFGPDCDSLPCIRREWKLPAFPETEALDLAVPGWRAAGEVISNIVVNLGGEPLDLTLPCRHESEKVMTMVFSQKDFFGTVDGVGGA